MMMMINKPEHPFTCGCPFDKVQFQSKANSRLNRYVFTLITVNIQDFMTAVDHMTIFFGVSELYSS